MTTIALAHYLTDALELLDRDLMDETDETEHPAAYSARALGAELRISSALAETILDYLAAQGRATPLKAHGAIVYARKQDGDLAFGTVNRVVPVLHARDQAADERTPSTGGFRHYALKRSRPASQLGVNLKRA